MRPDLVEGHALLALRLSKGAKPIEDSGPAGIADSDPVGKGGREKRFASRISGHIIIAEKNYFAVDSNGYPARQPALFVNSF